MSPTTSIARLKILQMIKTKKLININKSFFSFIEFHSSFFFLILFSSIDNIDFKILFPE